jgi:hypothetical protein
MPIAASPLSHGAVLEALRNAYEDLRFACTIFPEIPDRSMDQAMHTVACARRRIFESYLHDSKGSSDIQAAA